MIWIILIIIVIAVYFFEGPTAGSLVLFFFLLGIILRWFSRRAVVQLNEMEFGVVFDLDGNFSHFLDSGHHHINPFTQRLETTISKGPQNAHGRTEKIRTKEGIPVTVTWSISSKIDVFYIKPSLEHRMARALPNNAPKILGGKTIHALRHIIEQKSIHDLYTQGSIRKLEDEVRQEVYQRSLALGFRPISPSDITLGPIEMPYEIADMVIGKNKLTTSLSIHRQQDERSIVDKDQLLDLLQKAFSLDEFKTICFILDVKYENLGGEGLLGRQRELIKHLERQDRLDELIELIRKQRPGLIE